MSTVEELTCTRETFGPAPSTVIGMWLGRSKLIGNVVALFMVAPYDLWYPATPGIYQNDITFRGPVNSSGAKASPGQPGDGSPEAQLKPSNDPLMAHEDQQAANEPENHARHAP